MNHLAITQNATLPQAYESARQALATCTRIDECKDWADRSAALASYAKQAADDELMNHARSIQLRAVRRMGELIEQIEPSKGGRPPETTVVSHSGFSRTQAAVDAGLSEHQQVQAVRVARVPKDEFDRLIDSGKPPTVTAMAEIGKRPHVANNSGENEWYTPAEYIEAARLLMGRISLDPASSDKAQETVKADRYFTIEDDGLSQRWAGSVWLNPPYSSDLVGRFCEKLIDEYLNGDVTTAVLLVNNATETRWFQSASKHALSLCFPQGRIRYNAANGITKYTPLQGQCFMYFGTGKDVFSRLFGDFGLVVSVG